jgi:hypothetical protein
MRSRIAAHRIVRTTVIPVVMILAALLLAVPALADNNVDTLINQLNNDDSDKVRLSAALNLTRNGDQKAILPMVKALGNDSDKNVRGACAVGLSKLVNASTKSSIKGLAVSALKTAEANDASDFVKQQAAKALATITGSGGSSSTGTGNTGTAPSGGGGGIYVNVGPMSAKTGNNDKKFQALMVTIATKTLGKTAKNMATTWPGGTPSKAQLAAKKIEGFYVDGTLNELKVKQSGSSSIVSCKISMLLASFPDKSVFGFLNGGASVQASSSEKDEALAAEDCVSAVVEDLIAKKIVPTICTKATGPCP